MLLEPTLRLSAFDTHRWVVSTQAGHNLLVNDNTAQLLQLLREAASREQARQQANQHFGTALTPAEFDKLLQARFGGYGILAQDQPEQRPVNDPAYIKLKVELLTARGAAFGAAPLRTLYRPLVFWLLFPVLLGYLLLVHLLHPALLPVPPADYWMVGLLVYLSVFVHEFGHIAACSRFGVRHGGIGFGFYMYLFPVLYADVSNIWQATRHQRIITNLAGIFSQTLYAAGLATGYLLTHWLPLLAAAMTTTVLALWQFNPFIRRDGYWLLSDLTNTPNLLAKAAQVTRRGLSWDGLQRAVSSRGRVLRQKQIFLFGYGLVNGSLLLIFAGYTLARYGQQILAFPGLLLHLLHSIVAGRLPTVEAKQIQLLVVAFYLLLLRTLVTYAYRWWAQPARPAVSLPANLG